MDPGPLPRLTDRSYKHNYYDEKISWRSVRAYGC